MTVYFKSKEEALFYIEREKENTKKKKSYR